MDDLSILWSLPRIPLGVILFKTDIRTTLGRQKISRYFHSMEVAEAFCLIRGYLLTYRKQALGTLVVTRFFSIIER
jgi:hypothetical protein